MSVPFSLLIPWSKVATHNRDGWVRVVGPPSSRTHLISNDGEVWYECPDDKFRAFLADESVDFWVDWSDGTKQEVVRLQTIRSMCGTALPSGTPPAAIAIETISHAAIVAAVTP